MFITVLFGKKVGNVVFNVSAVIIVSEIAVDIPGVH
jgi:hypothetical protein